MLVRSLLGALRAPHRLVPSSRQRFLTQRQFEREVMRERLRASRRNSPYCIITINYATGPQTSRRIGQLNQILQRNLRATDEIAMSAVGAYAVLLPDTPEAGGRIAADRLRDLFDQRALPVELELTAPEPHELKIAASDRPHSPAIGMPPLFVPDLKPPRRHLLKRRRAQLEGAE